GCGTRIVLRGQKPLALCDRCPCFGSLHPPLAALTFAASSIICAFGLASAAPRSPYRHLELCGVALAHILNNIKNRRRAGRYLLRFCAVFLFLCDNERFTGYPTARGSGTAFPPRHGRWSGPAPTSV
ncbi:MAG: hypothetical protein PUI75_09470, partial [Subdoligranulum sp.]|nr:hypothetical protein [Subdoligranulum sp.]